MSIIRVKQASAFIFPVFVLVLTLLGLALTVASAPETPSAIPLIEASLIKEPHVRGAVATSSYTFFHGGLDSAELWRTNHAGTGVVLLKTFPNPINNLTVFNNSVIFTIDDVQSGFELWRSDGTSNGTKLIKKIDYSYPGVFLAAPDVVYFFVPKADNIEFWKTDGSARGTVLIKAFAYEFNWDYGAVNIDLLPNDRSLFLSISDGEHGNEVWMSDGTQSGTYLLKDINPGSDPSSPGFMADLNGIVLFSADDGVHGRELWITDGTLAGTKMLQDILPDIVSSSPSFLGQTSTRIFFTADDGVHGDELWISNGTISGTFLVKDINPGATGSKHVGNYHGEQKIIGGNLFFVANDGTHGDELWISDGTEVGTSLVKDIYPGGESGLPNYFDYFPWGAIGEAAGKVYFGADDGVHGVECWRSDGTEAGTFMIRDNDYTGDGGCQPIQSMDDIFLYAAKDGALAQIWATKGTPTETVKITEHQYVYGFVPLFPYPSPSNLEIVGIYGKPEVSENFEAGGSLWALHRNDIEHLFLPEVLNNVDVLKVTGEIIFISDRDDGNYQVFNMTNLTNGDVRRLTDDSFQYGDPDCSSDGRIVLNAGETAADGIYLLAYDTGVITRVGDESLIGVEPVWSPDNERLAFAYAGDIYTVRLDGTGLRQLTTNTSLESDPEWSPDGSELAFTSDRSGLLQLYVMNTNGQNIRPLLPGWSNIKEPSWSPDGRAVAFYSDSDGDDEIYKLILETGYVFQLTNNDNADDRAPVWSPDGQWILYEREQDGNNELYVMDSEDGRFARLTYDSSFDWGGCWYQRP